MDTIKRADLSVIIITKNEAHDIRDCLASIAWANEIIVLDSGSTDDTVNIAREYTQHVYIASDWQGFGVQKNRALAYATKDWVLSLDADERVDVALKTEINQVLQSPNLDIYYMPRLSSFCGRFIHHSGWRPDYVARLFKRGSAQFSNHLVHESLTFTAPAGHLTQSLLHLSYKNLDEVLDKMQRYAMLGAAELHANNKRTSLPGAVGHGAWAFVRTYIIRLGFLDGAQGFMLAINNAETTYYKYLQLYFLTKQST
ncbi:glycosyltransferase family 2 protein [Methylotenera sp.]|uniref:glycosyltransferase family 2 protein n=1 Tax=Methylotenera sp. TaxID=2051956 RepID=UPI002730A08B|nr:glycosyltransferase family 2 protein [Methylotenera sp.]MDP2070951.1 glycosyltransferase family 2 protein [Methylotenera sp.]MDP3005825.1 glycosyltransferase family 2 protein [Methylotenera sp.]